MIRAVLAYRDKHGLSGIAVNDLERVEILKDTEYERLVAEETLILAATEEICRVMGPAQDSGTVSRKELSDRLGKSKGFVTQCLSGDRNMTLRTLADFAFALGHRVEVKLLPVPGEPGEKVPVEASTEGEQ